MQRLKRLKGLKRVASGLWQSVAFVEDGSCCGQSYGSHCMVALRLLGFYVALCLSCWMFVQLPPRRRSMRTPGSPHRPQTWQVAEQKSFSVVRDLQAHDLIGAGRRSALGRGAATGAVLRMPAVMRQYRCGPQHHCGCQGRCGVSGVRPSRIQTQHVAVSLWQNLRWHVGASPFRQLRPTLRPIPLQSEPCQSLFATGLGIS